MANSPLFILSLNVSSSLCLVFAYYYLAIICTLILLENLCGKLLFFEEIDVPYKQETMVINLNIIKRKYPGCTQQDFFVPLQSSSSLNFSHILFLSSFLF